MFFFKRFFGLNKTWFIRAGLVFLILSFFIGFFWPILFTPDSQQSPSVSPTPGLPSFTSSDNTTATVKKLENRLIFFCQDAGQEQLAQIAAGLRAVEGVERVLSGSTVFDVSLSKNASSSSLSSLEQAFSSLCPSGSGFRRAAELDFASSVTFTPPQGFDPIVARLPSTLCRQPNWSCLVLLSTQENATISAIVTLTRAEDGSEQGVVQEVPGLDALPSPSPFPSPSAS
ncbi:MAG: hypothetical protein QXR53_00775 [Candidatus Norongarragalinales archaeon]